MQTKKTIRFYLFPFNFSPSHFLRVINPNRNADCFSCANVYADSKYAGNICGLLNSHRRADSKCLLRPACRLHHRGLCTRPG